MVLTIFCLPFLKEADECLYVQIVASGFGEYPAATSLQHVAGLGVDAVACTDAQGNGFLLVAPGSNLNFEETDRGVVLTVNNVVSGLCGKLSDTAYPVYTNDVEPLKGRLCLYPLQAGRWPQEVSQLFLTEPGKSVKAQNPFLSVYDTYLLKYDDAVQ